MVGVRYLFHSILLLCGFCYFCLLLLTLIKSLIGGQCRLCSFHGNFTVTEVSLTLASFIKWFNLQENK